MQAGMNHIIFIDVGRNESDQIPPTVHSFLPFSLSNLSRKAILCRRTCSGSGVDCRTAVASSRRPGPASAALMTGIEGAAAAGAALLVDDGAVDCVGLGVATVCVPIHRVLRVLLA